MIGPTWRAECKFIGFDRNSKRRLFNAANEARQESKTPPVVLNERRFGSKPVNHRQVISALRSSTRRTPAHNRLERRVGQAEHTMC